MERFASLPAIESDIQKVGYSHSKGRGVPIEVVRLSELRARPLDIDIYAPTRHDFYLLKFVTRGSGCHWVDFVRHDISEGDVLQVRPDQVHAFDVGSNHEALLFLFQPEAAPADQIQRLAVHLNAPFHLGPKDFSFLLQLLHFLLKMDEIPEHLRLSSMAPGLLQAVISGLDDLYSRHSKSLQSPAHHRASELMYRFERLLHQQARRHRLSEFSEALHVTEKTLARACHEIRGLSPKKLIDQHFTLEAKRKLILGDDSVEQIAFDLGFSEATNFIKFFKRIAGQTPQAFRAKQRESGG